MTNTANAPERDNMPDTIMAWPDFDGCITGAWSANQYSDERAREYISRAHCDELVAAAYLDAARVPTSFLVGDPPNGIPFRSPMAHEVAEAIKDRTPDDASATLTAFGERMKAEGAKAAHEEAFARGANWAQEKARVEGRLVIVDSPELAKLRADLAEAQAKIARLTNALEEIADRHIPDQPAALDISEAEYVRRQHTELRRTARATLAEVRRFAGAALQENANG